MALKLNKPPLQGLQSARLIVRHKVMGSKFLMYIRRQHAPSQELVALVVLVYVMASSSIAEAMSSPGPRERTPRIRNHRHVLGNILVCCPLLC